ncbi:MAG: DUF374 domain-containing protein [Gemmatimonadetes bacterium]|nr:DUF374 domain-containing protein [Gemmatimonadota bacterium]
MDRAGLPFRITTFAAARMLGLLGHSLRYEIEGAEHFEECRRRRQPFIFAHWHAWILPLAFLHRKEGIVVLVSDHKDGEYIARVIERMGFRTARGSSTRGGVKGLKALVRAGREGFDMGITPDGPRGPAREFKQGGLLAAQLSGAPIIPIAMESDSVWRLDSWDRFAIPKPFARIRVRYGAPHFVPRGASEVELAGHARAIEADLNVLFPSPPAPAPGADARDAHPPAAPRSGE